MARTKANNGQALRRQLSLSAGAKEVEPLAAGRTPHKCAALGRYLLDHFSALLISRMAKAEGAYRRLSHAAAGPYARHQSDMDTSFTDLLPMHISRDYLEIRPSDERKGILRHAADTSNWRN
ncbi:hypothetical protein QA641_35885 [Bradyrhizobium sp. CB1650]|uniref:hypothetical protein n=1 Tax=Bradyrhizobium sp. CB1650 TaxID=3039153 RepID=UPI002435C499|nr:hypothetical protein [Bradyrhizobium sp. CB1650]WGD50911.1 hypothetical protein QA641_35885 [Bradyrhizobium sp. CB1650]